MLLLLLQFECHPQRALSSGAAAILCSHGIALQPRRLAATPTCGRLPWNWATSCSSQLRAGDVSKKHREGTPLTRRIVARRGLVDPDEFGPVFLDPSERGFKLPGFSLTRMSDGILLRARPRFFGDATVLIASLLPFLLAIPPDPTRQAILFVCLFCASLIWPFLSHRRALRRATNTVRTLHRTLFIDTAHVTYGRPAIEVDCVQVPGRDLLRVVVSKDPDRRITDDTPSPIDIYLVTRHAMFLVARTHVEGYAMRVAVFIAHLARVRVRTVGPDTSSGAALVLALAHAAVSATVLVLVLVFPGLHTGTVTAWLALHAGITFLLYPTLRRLHGRVAESFALRVGVEPPPIEAPSSARGLDR